MACLFISLFLKIQSGRAGRDGENADCILFYSYKDKQVLEKMIRNGSDDKYNPSVRRKVDQLYTCVRYCEDEFRCRRTMQLEFFGERFDRMKCNKTCDNCRAGKQPEKRDMTAEAIAIINLFNSASNNNRRGVTMLQLSELYRGSKSKTITKNYQIKGMIGFGAGSKLKKHDIEKITHAMIFERILVENSIENKSGFTSDYVGLGENSSLLMRGSRQFFVEFPRKVTAAKAKTTNPKTKDSTKKKSSTKEPKRPKAKKSTSSKDTRTDATDMGGLRFTEIEVGDSDDDDDSMLDGSKESAHNSDNMEPVLPHQHTKKIADVLKTLVRRWADEEQLMGNNVHCKSNIHVENICLRRANATKLTKAFLLFPIFVILFKIVSDWNILTGEDVKTIASDAPTSLDELKALGILGEKKLEEYGARIVKPIKRYVEKEGLEDQLLERKQTAKSFKESTGTATTRIRPSKEIIEIQDDDDDEFDDGIDYSAIDLGY